MAVDSMLERYLQERDHKLTLIDNFTTAADDAGRDLYDNELTTISEAQDRVAFLNRHIDQLSTNLELAETTQQRIRSLDPNVVSKNFTYRSAGELLHDLIHRSQDSDAQIRLTKFTRAAEHMGFDKANTVAVAGGFNGLVVAPVLGPVLDPSPAGRPLFTALNPIQLTALTFNRPRIVDPNMSTGVGVVAKEKQEMPSKAWDILSEPVTTTRVGGYINVSGVLEEMIASSLDMVVSHMNRRLEFITEATVVTELGRTGASITLANTADSSAINKVFGQAATLVIQATGQMPQWVAMGPIAWGRLIGVTDLAGRPLLPPVGPVNAWGSADASGYFQSIAGLRVIVSPAIKDATMYVGNNWGIEVYERRMPMMQALEPSLYGRQVAVASFIGFYHPITTEDDTTPVRNSVVKIAWAA